MSVSILVVTWNNADEVAACLDAALAQDVDGVEVVVVDNASTDGTPDVLRRYDGRVRVVTSTTNLGYAAANNVASGLATGDRVLLLNPDCVMDDGCLRALCAHLDTTPGCGAVAAQLRFPDGRPQAFARRDITLSSAWWCLTETGSRMDVKLLHGRHRSRRWYDDLSPDADVVTVDGAAAACVLLRRDDVGDELFDEQFPLLYNDSDLYRRLGRRGLATHVVRRATAVHHYGTGLARVPGARLRAEAMTSLLRYADRWWRPRDRAALRALLLLDCLACAVMVVLRRRPDDARTALSGTWGGLGLPGGARPWLAAAHPS